VLETALVFFFVILPLMSTPILEIKNLVKAYDTKKERSVAVNDLSLSIPRGSFFGLLGPNGAGKSTTIHCITGIAQPTSGSVIVDGVDVVTDYKRARTKVGLSPQEFNVDIFATPEQLMDYMGGYYGVPKAERQKRIEELIKQFDLEKHRDVKFQKLSGGLKRRAMLGRALIHTPDLLILDEPTAGVDVEQRHELWEYLKQLNQSGKTIILTSHYLEEIEYLCRDIAIINHGKIVAQGTREEFMKGGKSVEERYLEITREDNAKNHG
jgi:ABC-2 type transport system ATP-binding protein